MSKLFLKMSLTTTHDSDLSNASGEESLRQKRHNNTDGRLTPAHKMTFEIHKSIISHINSYHPSVSHYRRKHAPLRRYLPFD